MSPVPAHHETKTVLAHIGDLRKRIILAVLAVIIGASIAHFFHREIIAFLLRPVGDQRLIFLSPLEPLFFILKIDAIVGIILASPVIIACIFSYIMPALPRHVTKTMYILYATSTILILTGLWYAFFVTIPLSLRFLFSIVIPGIENTVSAQSYLGFFIAQALIIIAIFQVPIFIVGGIYTTLFTTKTLASKRRLIYLIVIITLSILTPTTDLFSLGMVLAPCLIIFELSLIVGRVVEFLRKKKKSTQE